MIDPRLSETCERIRIGVKKRVIAEHELPGAQMPPDIRIGHAASCHGEQAQSQHGYEDAASCKNLGHYVARHYATT